MTDSTHSHPPRIRLPLKRQAALLGAYVRERIFRQVHAVAFITVYLLLFQAFVLRAPIANFAQVAAGILAVVVGLAAFMEGLFLAIMPLGERCGLRLPARAGMSILVVFAAVLGITATYAEPAIGFLKAQGSATLPWRAPLLYYLLNRGAALTVGAVAAGVGMAVVLGVFRFLRAWSIKPFLYSAMPLLLAASYWASRDPRASVAIGLAWDSGGVTTGPVTVPLLIALGIGVSRIAGRGDEPSGGLGVVTFASALPVFFLLVLALVLAPRFPAPCSAEDFFSPSNREMALRVVGSESALRTFATDSLAPDLFAKQLESPQSAQDNRFGHALPASEWHVHAVNSIKAIFPLAVVLLFALLAVVREKIPCPDEVALGLVLSLAGMLLFGYGMDRGLSNLGNQAGRSLPRAWQATELPDRAVQFLNLDESMLVRAAKPDGSSAEYLPIASTSEPEFVPFHRDRFDPVSRTYEWIPEQRPVAGDAALWGYALVLVFVFVMGVGATVAEPSLNALGITLEELTTGTYRRSFLILTVSLGVGIGMAVGFCRILFAWPLVPLLAATYAAAIALTYFSSEDMAAIAWDCAGVTTGPITVPLVIAAGLGIGQRSGVAEAFGVVTMASVFPILAVLLSGFLFSARRDGLDRDSDEKVSHADPASPEVRP